MTRTVLFLLSLSVLSGCTNVTGDTPRTISPQEAENLTAERLFSVADTFFSEAGYACSADADAGQFRCSRALRDLYIHQTTAEVNIYPGGEEDKTHRMIATRWDEGLIPGELIANTYANDDVEAFCAYLASEKLGRCSDYQG
ncbi:hypothetical protein [Alcanivorax sp. NBRC 102024]|uniref:hypothetical protein n=1 Tax=Alcanivorax sp. NBRC 102024 TaxID=1113895 RepID=UPI000789E6D9|nr:hypothetical protein [Alcanivorax sp. NBRC 102024]